MPKGLAKAYLIGNCGNDPEVRTTADGIRVASFSLAVNRKRGDTEETDWYRISAWRGLADIVEKYVKKGSAVAVDGALSIRQYEHNGKPGTSVELDARDLVLLDPPPSSSNAPAMGEGGSPFAEKDALPF